MTGSIAANCTSPSMGTVGFRIWTQPVITTIWGLSLVKEASQAGNLANYGRYGLSTHIDKASSRRKILS
ncbi:unnamed protein product, partial [Didymodactylos carnosus]